MATTSPSTRGATDTPVDIEAYSLRMIADINQRLTALEQTVRDTRLMVAAQLEALAEDLGYPINDIAKTRKHIRDLAARLRAGMQGERHG